MLSRAWVVVMLSLAVCGSLPAQNSSSPIQESRDAPVELVLRDEAGSEQRLSGYRGKIVILNFWATWCVPCRDEMPMLVRIAKEYESRGVLVIGPSADAPETQDQIAPFLRKVAITFPIWVGATTEHMEELGLGTALPATAVIDRDGRIVGRILGPLEEKDLQARLEWLLSDPSKRGPAPAAVLNTFEKHQHEHGEEAGHEHEGEEDHQHGGVGMEGASIVPS